MTQQLQGKRVAILVANGFEQAELAEPKKALEEAGASTLIVSPEARRGEGLEGEGVGRHVSRGRDPG